MITTTNNYTTPRISPVDFEPEDEDINSLITRHRETLEFRTRITRREQADNFVVGVLFGLLLSVVLYAVGGAVIWLGIKAGV